MPKKLSRSERKAIQIKFFEAAIAGDLEALKIYQKNGADINADRDGGYDDNETVMKIAISLNHEKMVHYLIEQAGVGFDDILLAIERKLFSLAKTLLLSTISNYTEEYKTKLLHTVLLPLIVDLDDPYCIAMKNIISIHTGKLDKKLVTLVRTGVNTLSLEEIELIRTNPYLLHEFSGMTRDMGNTFLLEAIIRDNTSIASQLIQLDSEKHSLDIASKCYMASNTPLVLALKRGNIEIAQALILAGADVNKPGFRGFTPLHWACILRLNSIIEQLLAAGANPAIQNAFGKQALEYYISDISSEAISFSPSHAIIRGQDIEMEDIAYNCKEVIFVPCRGFKEYTKHNFSTKIPDFSDMYWHMEGILINHGLAELIISSGTYENDYPLYTDIFSEIRNQRVVEPDLVGRLKQKMTVSALSFFAVSKLPIDTETSRNFDMLCMK